jgi:ABC-type glycerol-3-phosphate transport system substrate-binding protein
MSPWAATTSNWLKGRYLMTSTLDRRRFLQRAALTGLGLGVGPAFLAACGDGGTSQSSAKPSSLSSLWVPYDQLANAGKQLMSAWTKSSGIEVAFNTVPWADWDRRIRAIPSQPDSPDVMIVDGPALEGYAVNGILAPLDDYFPAADLADFLPGTTPAARWKGKFYGPATNESSQAVVYNKTILDRYGVTPPTELSQAWTWSHLREVMIEIQKGERKRRGDDQFWGLFLGQGNFIGGGTYTGLDLIRTAGAKDSPTYKAISDDGLSVSGYADTSEAMTAYQFLQDLYQADQLSPQSKSPDFFYNDQVAFWLTNPDVAVGGIKAKSPAMKWAAMPHPYTVTPLVQTDSYHLGVSATSKYIDYASQLVAYMMSKEGATLMAQAQDALPARKSSLAAMAQYSSPPLKVFADTVDQWAVPRPITPGWSEYDTIYSQMLTDIAMGADIQPTVSKAVEQIDTQLDRYRSLVR